MNLKEKPHTVHIVNCSVLFYSNCTICVTNKMKNVNVLVLGTASFSSAHL